MGYLLFIFLMLFSINIQSIQLFPSGITVDFDSPKKVTRKTYFLQSGEEKEKKSLKTEKIIRVINSLTDISKNNFLALVFYNHKNKVIGYNIIRNTKKPKPAEVFFIDRDTGRQFQGMLDIYAIPKKTVSFALAFVNKRGKVLSQPFTHPDFNEQGKISLEQFLALSLNKKVMLQYEVTGNSEKPSVKLGGFHFVK